VTELGISHHTKACIAPNMFIYASVDASIATDIRRMQRQKQHWGGGELLSQWITTHYGNL
jgi:hypothetical protein